MTEVGPCRCDEEERLLCGRRCEIVVTGTGCVPEGILLLWRILRELGANEMQRRCVVGYFSRNMFAMVVVSFR